jgi:hypothetical protein
MTITYTYSTELWSDLHKDARGYRPSAQDYHLWLNYSPEEKQIVWDILLAELKRSIEDDLANDFDYDID